MSNEDNDRERDGMGVALPVATAVIIAVATTLFTGVGMVRKKAAAQAEPAASAVVSATAVAEQVASALESKAVPVAPVTMAASDAASAPVASAVPAAATPDGAHVEVVDGVVRFYFAVGKADLAAGAKEALAEAVAAAKAGKMLVVSGFHDSTGSVAINAELAKKRAFAVRDALLAEGVVESNITLQKPEAMPNTHGSDPNARRVDVVIQ